MEVVAKQVHVLGLRRPPIFRKTLVPPARRSCPTLAFLTLFKFDGGNVLVRPCRVPAESTRLQAVNVFHQQGALPFVLRRLVPLHLDIPQLQVPGAAENHGRSRQIVRLRGSLAMKNLMFSKVMPSSGLSGWPSILDVPWQCTMMSWMITSLIMPGPGSPGLGSLVIPFAGTIDCGN